MSNIPTQAEYEAQEARRLAKQLEEVECAPLADRQEARNNWQRAIAEDPALVGERIGWILNGSYGFGACKAAVEIVNGTIRNKPALAQLVAALEWLCPNGYARQAWRNLNAKQKKALDRAIIAAMKTEPAIT